MNFFKAAIKTATILVGTFHIAHNTYNVTNDLAHSAVKWSANKMGYIHEEKPPEPSLRALATKYALQRNLSPVWVWGIIQAESHGERDARSAKGALSVMQVMPFQASRCGTTVTGLHDAETNIACGTKLLAEFLKEQHGNAIKATMEYNCGPRCISTGNIPDETIKYVTNVTNNIIKDTIS